MKLLRCNRSLMSSVEIDLINDTYTRAAPEKELGIKLIFSNNSGSGTGNDNSNKNKSSSNGGGTGSSGGNTTFFLKFSKNKHLMWSWVRWLKLGAALASKNRSSADPLPSWAAQGKFRSLLTLQAEAHGGASSGIIGRAAGAVNPLGGSGGSGGGASGTAGMADEAYTGNCIITLQPFQLVCQHPESSAILKTLPLQGLERIVASVDAAQPKPYSLQLEVVSAHLDVYRKGHHSHRNSHGSGQGDEGHHHEVIVKKGGADGGKHAAASAAGPTSVGGQIAGNGAPA
jgi:hypothetical protein